MTLTSLFTVMAIQIFHDLHSSSISQHIVWSVTLTPLKREQLLITGHAAQ